MKLHCPNDQSLLETYLTLKFGLSPNDQSQPNFTLIPHGLCNGK
jgi:hypothetical protein